ncbi:MAG TPA: OsmC family protein [Candidatus Limnocylindrales bacterium]|nr:OsmC family protein [Candidatus Limnocylindrales bacterium]
MSTKTATLNLVGSMRFEAQVGSGHTVVMDNAEGDSGARPAELVGVALGGCTGMDVISILRKKRQQVTGYEIRVSGLQAEGHPNNFLRFDVVHVVDGVDIDAEAVRRAIELSATRYCSVGSTLASGGLELHHRYIIRTPGGGEIAGDVLVLGPNAIAGGVPASA